MDKGKGRKKKTPARSSIHICLIDYEKAFDQMKLDNEYNEKHSN